MSAFAKATGRRARALLTGVALAATSAVLLSACSTGTGTTETAAADGALPIKSGDRSLSLKIGTVLPQSGSLAFLGPPEIAGVALGAKDINDAAAGLKVDVINRDSGDTKTDTATVSVKDLLGQKVNAIIGAASSGVSKTIIDAIVAAGVIQFSPANTSPDFTNYADNNLYWRSAPSDLLQGEVLGNLISADGAKTLGIIYLNDAYGTGLNKQLTKTFEAAGGKVSASVAFNEGDTSFSSQISQVLATKPDAVALISFDQAKTVIPALVQAGVSASKLYLVDGNVADYSKDFAPGTLTGAQGTVPGGQLADDFKGRLKQIDPKLTDYSYGGESYDAVTLIALAAYAANSSEPTEIVKYLRQVSGGTGKGQKVTSFKDGAALLKEGKQIDYDGVSSPITFDEHGDPTQAIIGIYKYGADNKYTFVKNG